jgi:hypothetical protein
LVRATLVVMISTIPDSPFVGACMRTAGSSAGSLAANICADHTMDGLQVHQIWDGG